jgi:hypothetical protein
MFPTKVVELLIVATFIADKLLVKDTTFPTKVVDVLIDAILIEDELLLKFTTFPVKTVAVLIDDTLELKLTILPEMFAVRYLVDTEFDICEFDAR